MHRTMSRERALTPMVGGVEVSADAMIKAARKLVSGAQNPAIIISAQASNEELKAAQAALTDKFTVYTRKDYGPSHGEVLEDDFMICLDKNPNGDGVYRIFGRNVIDNPLEHDLVVVWGDNLRHEDVAGARLICLGSFASGREKDREVFVPISTLFERSGTFTNFEGVDNRFEQVFEKPSSVLHAADFFRRLSE